MSKKRKIFTFICLGITLLTGCSLQTIPNQYDVRLKTGQKEIAVKAGGETVQVEVSVDSYCFEELSSEGGVFLSYHILSADGEMLDYEGERTELDPIKARDRKKETVEVTVPLDAGDYIVEIDMLREGISWFSDQGMKTVRIPLKVLVSHDAD